MISLFETFINIHITQKLGIFAIIRKYIAGMISELKIVWKDNIALQESST